MSGLSNFTIVAFFAFAAIFAAAAIVELVSEVLADRLARTRRAAPAGKPTAADSDDHDDESGTHTKTYPHSALLFTEAGIESRRRVVLTRVAKEQVVLFNSKRPGFVILEVGPVPLGDFTYQSLGAASIELDAAACNHLARLLASKADDLVQARLMEPTS